MAITATTAATATAAHQALSEREMRDACARPGDRRLAVALAKAVVYRRVRLGLVQLPH